MGAIQNEALEKQREANRRSYRKHTEKRRAYYRELSAKRRAADPERYRAYQAKWSAENKDRVQEQRAARRPMYKEKELAYSRQWARDNPEKRKAYRIAHIGVWRERYRLWSKANPDKESARVRLRAAKKLGATPPWADKTAIMSFYAEAKNRTKETGVLHSVDHIIPLRGRAVCGLHWEGNLQVIPAVENSSKGNKWA